MTVVLLRDGSGEGLVEVERAGLEDARASGEVRAVEGVGRVALVDEREIEERVAVGKFRGQHSSYHTSAHPTHLPAWLDMSPQVPPPSPSPCRSQH